MSAFSTFTDETFRSLRTRNFRLFFTGQVISQIGNWMTLVVQTLLVLKITNSGIALGVLMVSQYGPVLLLGPWAGLIADRSDKRRLLMAVQSMAMLQSFVLAALAFMPHPPLYGLYLAALFGGITLAFDHPARRAFVVEMVEIQDVPNAVSLNSALMTGSRIVGPALAGLALATIGFGWAFIADGVSYIAVIVAFAMMRTSELQRSTPAKRESGQIRAGFRYARSVPDIWTPLIMMAVVGTLTYNFQVVFPLFTTRDLGGSKVTFTLLFSVMSMGALVGALAAARRRHIALRTVALSSIAFGAGMAVMSVTPNIWLAYPVSFLIGLASIAFLTAATGIFQINSTPEMRGRVLALQAMVFLGSTPIGGPILGWICERYGARWGIAVGAVAAIGAGLWGMSRVRARSNAVGNLPDQLGA
ncbi:arabinose efflux permease family protein [Actinobacteria bacterium IMCC26256]|nr:arabinose efflux permease family protein [Actinobacteria bacterium IMCC26256]